MILSNPCWSSLVSPLHSEAEAPVQRTGTEQRFSNKRSSAVYAYGVHAIYSLGICRNQPIFFGRVQRNANGSALQSWHLLSISLRLSSSTEQSTSSRLIRKHKRRRRKQRMRQIDRVRLASSLSKEVNHDFECSMWIRKGSRTDLCPVEFPGKAPSGSGLPRTKSLTFDVLQHWDQDSFSPLPFSFYCSVIPFLLASLKTSPCRRTSVMLLADVGSGGLWCQTSHV